MGSRVIDATGKLLVKLHPVEHRPPPLPCGRGLSSSLLQALVSGIVNEGGCGSGSQNEIAWIPSYVHSG